MKKIAPSKSVRIFPVLLILCFALTVVWGKRLPVKIYTSADGLGSGFVDSLFRDSRGFMWFCTRDGLSRFDGSRFVTYQVSENSSPGIEMIYETRNGTYWISTTAGTYRFNPNAISGRDTAKPNLNAEFITPNRGQFLEDSSGNLWFGSNEFLRLEEQDGKAVFRKFDLNLPPKPDVMFVVADLKEAPDGSLWINTSWGLVRRLPDSRTVFYPFDAPVNEGNSSVLVDKNGRVWLMRTREILVFKPEPIESLPEAEKLVIKSLTPTSVIDLKPEEVVPMPKKSGEVFELSGETYFTKIITKRPFQSSDGNIWITSENHLLEFADSVLHLHTESEGLSNVMGRMSEDAAGNLWIAGQTGVTRIDRHGLVTFGTNDGLNASRLFAITEGADGTLYFAGRAFYLNRFDGQKFQTVRPGIETDSQVLWTSRNALLSKNGDWWILTNEKLYRFSGINDFAALADKPPTKIYTTADGLKSNGMFQIYEDSDGDIWVSTRGKIATEHGVARLKKGAEKFHAFTEADGIPKGHAPSSFVEDAFSNLWISFYDGGVARFDGDRFQYFGKNEGLPEGVISDLHIDKKGRLWLSSTIRGLIRVDDTSAKTPNFIYLTTDNGLTSNNIRTITEDNFGRIYVGTASGVDRISPDTLRIKHYSVSDGLAADFVVDSHRDKDGNLWFATYNGVSRLVPLPDEKSSAPSIFVSGLRISGIERAVSELGNAEIKTDELTHTENNLQIDFFGLDFRAGETLRYQYKLEGSNADWSVPTEQRSVTFANLSPANYRFLVRAVNSEGIPSENPAVLSFRILPPIWLRWWFITLCVLALGLIAFLFYRYRISNLRTINEALTEAKSAEENLRKSNEDRLAELEKVRSRIATDLHDDIGASLTQIAILSEVAQAQSKGNGATEPLTKISLVSNELVGTMSDIVWSINPSKDHLSDLTQRMRRFASDILSAKGIAFQFVLPEASKEIIVNANVRREVFLIFKESTNNVVKHSEAKNVYIKLDISGNDLLLEISDDGKGFRSDPTALADGLNFDNYDTENYPTADTDGSDGFGGNGISSMQKRAAEMNGKLEVISKTGNGTTIKLRLPMEQSVKI